MKKLMYPHLGLLIGVMLLVFNCKKKEDPAPSTPTTPTNPVTTTAADISAIASPQKGMLVYDLTNNCLKLYNGAWVCLTSN